MAKYVANPVGTGFGAQSNLNQNFEDIEDNFQRVLYRDGSSPNQMEAVLDMNGNRIINLPNAASATEPVTYAQWVEGSQVVTFTGTVKEEQTAIAGQTVFTLLQAYTPGSSNLSVYINGVCQHPSAFVETDANTVTFSEGLAEGQQVLFVINERQVDTDVVPASSVTYTSPVNGATSVNSELNYLNKLTVNTVADMKALTGLSDGAIVQPKEYYLGDGFKPRQRVFIADATPPPESATVIHDNAGAGYFLLRDDGGAIDLRETGAKFDGVTDDTTNIQRGLNGFKWSENPPGKTAKVTAKLTIPAFAKWAGAGKYSSIISKEFNGDFADIGTGAVVDGFAVLGNGGTYTGRGFLANSGSGSQIFGGQMRIVDFNGYCIECTADGAGNGMQVLQGAEISRTTAGDVAIRLPVDTSAKPRFFIGVNGSSSTLIDCNGADDVIVHGCFMRNILTTSSTKKLALTGNRIATVGSGLRLYGVNHSITGNIVAGDIVAESGLTSSTISGNLTAGVITDNSASASNTIYEYSLDYTPTWLGSVTNPVIGNGSISGKLIRRGKMVTLQIVLNIGSTTTTGSGIWTFGLPASLQYLKGKFTSAGVARGFRSGVAFYTGVTIGNTSASNFVINVTTSGGSNNWGPTVPATWATGDQILIQHEYEIST